MKEKILEALKALGFELEEMDGALYGFHYEGKSFLYIPSESDADFLNLALPCVYEIKDEDEAMGNLLMEKLNATMKYVKAYKAFEGISLFYERELIGDEDLQAILSKMILHLDVGMSVLAHMLSDTDENNT